MYRTHDLLKALQDLIRVTHHCLDAFRCPSDEIFSQVVELLTFLLVFCIQNINRTMQVFNFSVVIFTCRTRGYCIFNFALSSCIWTTLVQFTKSMVVGEADASRGRKAGRTTEAALRKGM